MRHINYVLKVDRERSLQTLMTVNLLKRLESSVHAFRLTLRSLRDNHAGTLARIAAFKKDGRSASVTDLTEALSDLDPEDDDLPDFEDPSGPGSDAVGGKIKITLADMDLPRWEHVLTEDLRLIEALLASMDLVTPAEDAKLQHLKAHVLGKIARPINPGNRKVLLFTAFADTADYLYANLAPELLSQLHLHSAKVTGKDSPAQERAQQAQRKRA